MSVDVAYDGNDGFGMASLPGYDVVVLDRDLPGVSGDDICRSVTASNAATRVIMVTASSSAEAMADGLALGASDYVTKPFVFADLVERVRALGHTA